jgi:hypothetical protein
LPGAQIGDVPVRGAVGVREVDPVTHAQLADVQTSALQAVSGNFNAQEIRDLILTNQKYRGSPKTFKAGVVAWGTDWRRAGARGGRRT